MEERKGTEAERRGEKQDGGDDTGLLRGRFLWPAQYCRDPLARHSQIRFSPSHVCAPSSRLGFVGV